MIFQDIDKKKIRKNRKYYTRENEITQEARFVSLCLFLAASIAIVGSLIFQ